MSNGNRGRHWRWASRSKPDTTMGYSESYSQSTTNDHNQQQRQGSPIDRFSGRFKWLGNFSWSDLEFEGDWYPSVEHAFQAAKVANKTERSGYGFTDAKLSFGDAKRLGRSVPLRQDWKEIRENVMAACLAAKFTDPTLRQKLLATGDSELIDGHSGSPDLIWGYHFPSQAGENRLGKLLMELRHSLRSDSACNREMEDYNPRQQNVYLAEAVVSLYILDWPLKCLHDGLPQAYADRICKFAQEAGLLGRLIVLPRRKICVALSGNMASMESWENRMRTEYVDVNSRGRPCRERMLVLLLHAQQSNTHHQTETAPFSRIDVQTWADLQTEITSILNISREEVCKALGPEAPELPRNVRYLDNRTAALLDGKQYALCLNDADAPVISEELLGIPDIQSPLGPGEHISLACGSANGKPSIFGGKFARVLRGLLSADECKMLISLSEKHGYGLAGSRGFNPFARFVQRCLIDAPKMASAITSRLSSLLPEEYPAGTGRHLVGVNERFRFLKYAPGMHHSGDHTDCAHEDSRGKSFLTVQLYLNDGFCGGRTTFISDQLVPIEPTPGAAVIFDHELYHRGGMVTQGTKYAVRLDVIYSHAEIGEYSHYPKRKGMSKGSPGKVDAGSDHAQKRSGRWSRQR